MRRLRRRAPTLSPYHPTIPPTLTPLSLIPKKPSLYHTNDPVSPPPKDVLRRCERLTLLGMAPRSHPPSEAEERGFFEHGLDSAIAPELLANLARRLQRPPLPTSLIFEYPTPTMLGAFLASLGVSSQVHPPAPYVFVPYVKAHFSLHIAGFCLLNLHHAPSFPVGETGGIGSVSTSTAPHRPRHRRGSREGWCELAWLKCPVARRRSVGRRLVARRRERRRSDH